MRTFKWKKGFTLIEMLVVIAIIAVLVSIVIPIVCSATTKANAATDAANLRSALGVLDSVVFTESKEVAEEEAGNLNLKCKSFPEATLAVVYNYPAFIDVYFSDGSSYYGLDYFSEVAETGSSSVSTGLPPVPANSTWIPID